MKRKVKTISKTTKNPRQASNAKRVTPHPTIADVAASAGVSPALVSQIMNKRPVRVAEKTRERVLEAIERLDYVPHAGARMIGGRRFQCVGLVISAGEAYSHFVNSELLHGIAEGLNNRGYRLTIMHLGDDALADPKKIPSLHREWQVDGLLCAVPTQRLPRGTDELLRHHRVPAVFINGKGFEHVVRPDDYATGREAVRYLMQMGHRRIIHVTNSYTSHYSREDRYEGWADACRENKLPIPDEWYEYSRTFGSREWAELLANLKAEERPTAAATYSSHLRLWNAMEEQGRRLRIPDDLSVFCQMSANTKLQAERDGITGCYFDWNAIGQRGAELLIQIIESDQDNGETSEHSIPEGELLEPPKMSFGRTVQRLRT